ncbi:MAG: tRNA (adenosine(37)-N6)-dimethylallyltransferase MiaA [Gammaproteobacteria bacterium]|nr:tRNA (adenosine(37)-N6)-dimethylallyltransferase MiaA [Gammaproteobacteria bacterium]
MSTNAGDSRPVVLLMGPTGAGKTDVAVALAARGPFDIVSVDSAMVFRGMDIGTAKPGPAVLARAPHRLIDIRDPAESYSAAQFRSDALAAIEVIHRRGRLPLLVGGTGLYFRALTRGLARLPAADPQLRGRLREHVRRHGLAALHARLRCVDPDAAARIHPNDPQRIERALEVYELTGQPLTRLLAATAGNPSPYRFDKIVLAPADRAALHRRLAQRFTGMLAAGLLEEVAALRARGDLHAGMPAIRVVGYRQCWQHLAGEYDRPALVDRAIAATRQLAKRQLTWLRAEDECEWIDSTGDDPVARVELVLRRTGRL